MCRLSGLILLGLFGLNVSVSVACELKTCTSKPGAPNDVRYYMLLDEPAPFQVRYTYVNTGTTPGLIFDDGSGPYKRVVHEFRSPLVQVVCGADAAQFESDHGIESMTQIQGELFEVHDVNTGNRVGTVFIDRNNAGVQATGGGIAVEQTYACNVGGTLEPVMEKSAMFHSAFDVLAIDGATPAAIQREYIGPLRARLASRSDAHMTQQNCTAIALADFVAMVRAGRECKLHYDVGDPTAIVYGEPGS